MNVKHITMVSSGTRGDVQPYVALGLGLKKAGYQVRLVCAENFRPFVTAYDLEFCPGGEDIEALMRSPEIRQQMRRKLGPIETLRLLMRYLPEGVAKQIRLVWEACQGSDAIIGHFVDSWQTRPIAEALKIPFIDSGVVPNTRTAAFPYPFFPFQHSHGGIYNRFTADLVVRMAWFLLNPMIYRHQKRLFPRAPRSWWQRLDDPQTPMLYGYSPAFLPKPKDWGAHIHVTGYWTLAQHEPPPDSLVRFLEEGDPPVYIGFGSMPSGDPGKMTAMIVKAVQRCGQRSVLLTGWNGIAEMTLPPSIYVLNSIDHEWLFPRCAVVVHHGGAGTTGAGIRAGIPGVIIPLAGDQLFWAQRAHERGISTKPIARSKLTCERLVTAIEEALSDPQMQVTAEKLGQIVRAEDGVGQAAALVQSYLHSSG